MARPLKNINWDIVIKRLQAGNTARQIAQELEILDIDTFYRRFKDEFGIGFGDYPVKDAHECGKGNIAFTQYMKALSGNTEMLKLLGREWNGQGADLQPSIVANQENISLTNENMKMKHEIALLKEQLHGAMNGN